MNRLILPLAIIALAGPAFAGHVQTTLSVALGGGSTAPPGAAAANFTTLAVNSDFTQAMPSNWLGGCANAGDGSPVNTSDTTGHTWWLNIWWSNTYQHCLTKQVTDPSLGGTVLDMPWTVDISAENVGTVLQSAAWFSTGAPNTGVTIPNNAYYEIVMRIDPPQTFLGAWGGEFTWPLLAMTDGTKQGLEFDVIELDVWSLGNSDSAEHNWQAGNPPGGFLWEGYGPPGLPLTFNPFVYHTFGYRTTSDGATGLAACSYVDNVFIGCKSPPPGGFTSNIPTTRNFMILQNACDFWNYNVPCSNGQLQHMYVKTVKVWSCSSWQTTQCNGPILPGPP